MSVITDRDEILKAFAIEGHLLQRRGEDVVVGPFDRFYSLEVVQQMEQDGLVQMVGGKSILKWRLTVAPGVH